MQPARLEDRAVLALSGADVRPFLQGLITNNIENVGPGRAAYAALLTPQGKILFDFIIAEGDGALLLDCSAAHRDALAKRLKLYRLRAKVEIEPRDHLGVAGGLTGRPAERGNGFADPRLEALGPRFISAIAEMPDNVGTAQAYHAERLRLGVPEGSDFGSDKIFALDADLDELHAVAFDKGCYVGQELTARMKHRGTARKRLLPVNGDALPASGTVSAGGKDIGEMMSSYGSRGFALIRLDRLEEAAGAQVTVENKSITLEKPNWLLP
jgi:folate-binding protein YgfZ